MSEFDSRPLCELADCRMGETILSKDLDGTGYPIFSADSSAGAWGHKKQISKILKRGSIVIGARGTIGNPRLPDHDEFGCTQTTIAVTPSSEVDPHYLKLALESSDIRSIAAQQAVPMLTIGQIAQLEIAFPPLPEQKKIAEILSGIDDVVNGYTRQLQHRKLLHHAFWDAEVSGANNESDLVTLGEITIQSKRKGVENLPIYSVSVEHGMINRDSLERSLISNLDPKENLHAAKGNLCYNMMRMWQGASGIAPEDCLVSPAYVVCRPTNAVLPEYLAIACRSKESIEKFKASSRGLTSDRWRLYYEDFAKIEIPLPKKEKQIEIASRNRAMHHAIRDLQERLLKARNLRQSISSDLLSGRKRVSV